MPVLPDLVHDRRGSGEPLVLIHGIGHRRQIWDPIVDDLASRYEVLTIDLSGFGEPWRRGFEVRPAPPCGR